MFRTIFSGDSARWLVPCLVAVVAACGPSAGQATQQPPAATMIATNRLPSPSAVATTHPTAIAVATDGPLFPDGGWQVDLSAEEMIDAGASPADANPGTYTWTFEGRQARIRVNYDSGDMVLCDADAAPSGALVLLTYLRNSGCGGEVDTISWVFDEAGLHLSLVETNANFEANKAYLEAKAWQPVEAEALPSWPPWQLRCEPGCQGPIEAGTFTSEGFLPGLQMTIPDGDWFNTADYPDEIEIDTGTTALRFWRNPWASSERGDHLLDVPQTPSGLTSWFVANEDMVVSDPETVTIGDGIEATTFTMEISDTHVNVDAGCPVRSCLDVLWINEGHVFAIGYGEGVRFYLFTIEGVADDELIVVSIDGHDAGTVAALMARIEPILGSLSLP